MRPAGALEEEFCGADTAICRACALDLVKGRTNAQRFEFNRQT